MSRAETDLPFPQSYFRHSWDMSLNSWTTVESSALDKCGHCDNCLRSAKSSSATGQSKVITKDVTLATWQLLKMLQAMQNMKSDQTLAGLVKLARGLGGCKVDVPKGGGRARGKNGKEAVGVDLERVCGGPIKDLSADVSDKFILHFHLHPFFCQYRDPC